jgi:hypothetical protein
VKRVRNRKEVKEIDEAEEVKEGKRVILVGCEVNNKTPSPHVFCKC